MLDILPERVPKDGALLLDVRLSHHPAKGGRAAGTYVWAPSKSHDDLLAALQRGAAWFTDLARYRGTMDLRIGGVSHLGAVLVAKAAVKVDVIATAVPYGAAVEIVTGIVDEAAAVPSIKISKGGNISVSPGHYVRTQVRLKSGEVVGASNPLWVLAAEPRRPMRLRKAK